MNILQKVRKILDKNKDAKKLEGPIDVAKSRPDDPIPVPKDPTLKDK